MTKNTDDTAARAARPARKRLLWISGGTAVVLAATAAIVVPQAVHAQQVDEYTALIADQNTAHHERADAETLLIAAESLAQAQHREATRLAERIAALGKTAEPILAESDAKGLTAASEDVLMAIGDEPEAATGTTATPAASTDGEEVAEADPPLIIAVDALRDADAAAAKKAKDAGEDAPDPLAPASYLTLSPAEAAALLDDPVPAERTVAVPDDEVTAELIEQARAGLDGIRADTSRLGEELDEQESVMAGYAAALDAALPALRAAAETATDQAAKVVAKTKKAPKSSEAATKAAESAVEVATSGELVEIIDAVSSYVSKAKTAQKKHAEVVKKEKEEREAAERARRNRGSGSGGGGPMQLCNRWVPNFWGGGGSLQLVWC